MTLITRLITKERVIFWADGYLTYNGFKGPYTTDVCKILEIRDLLIGVSGTIEYGEYKTKRNILTTISTFLNDSENYDDTVQEKLFAYLIDDLRQNNKGRRIDIGLLISYKQDDILKHYYINLLWTIIIDFPRTIDEITSIEDQFYFDTNFRNNEYQSFIDLIQKASYQIYGLDLNNDIINKMTDEEIDKFGKILYILFSKEYKNNSVGPFFMKASV